MVLPKPMRINGYKCFDYIHKKGVRYNSSSIFIKVAPANPSLINNKSIKDRSINSFRCAVSISNKVSKRAVVRNQFRRIFHEHLQKRLLKLKTSKEFWILISLRPSSLDKGPVILLREVDKLLSKAGFLNDSL